jgi:hypothetical protein
MEDTMARNRYVVGVTILFLAVTASSCASRQDSAQPMASQDFGGQPKDQETRERHHPQYPESAQHLGPQEDQPAPNQAADKSNEQLEQERAAVSGVGK